MNEIEDNITSKGIIEDIDTLEDSIFNTDIEGLKGVTKEYKKRMLKLILNSKFLINYIHAPQIIFMPISNIPDKDGWQQKPILETKEPLVAFNSFNNETKQILQLHNRIFSKPAYYEKGIDKSSPIVYTRLAVAKSLLEYLEYLPKQYGIIVYDGYRPIEVQQFLYDTQYKIEQAKKENEGCTHKQLEAITNKYVSLPSKDPKKPSTHNTGGAIDFSICDEYGNELNFGCNFDDFRLVSNLAYFEDKLKAGENLSDSELEALLNRRVMCNLARHRRIGLEPYNGEWWHYDKNNQWDFKLSKALYGSVDLAGIIPNVHTIDIDDLIRHDDILLSNHKKYLTYKTLKQKKAAKQNIIKNV